MSPAVRELLHKALELPPEEREELVILLSDFLDRQPDREAYWEREIKRRLDEIDAGTVELVPGYKLKAMLDAAIERGSLRDWKEPNGDSDPE